MRKILFIVLLTPIIANAQLLTTVGQIASYNNPFAQLIIVNDTVRGGQFMPYAGTDAADSGMIFTDANGRKWKRAIRQDEGINIAWYGAATSQTATNNRNYVIKARDYIYSHGLNKMVVPKGNYQLSDSILFDQSIVIEGEGAIGYPVSQFIFPENTTGFVFQYVTSGFGVVMKNIKITGQLSVGYNKTNKHAIVQRTRGKFTNVVISQFDGNGFHLSACGTPPSGDNNNYGSVDNSVYEYVAAYYCTNGFFTEGCDGHILDIGEGCDFSQNRRWGYYGNGLLGGDVLYKTHFAFNGVAVPGANSVVTYGGKYYVAKSGFDGYYGDVTDSNYNKQPDTNPNYWYEVTPTMVATAWNNTTRYYSGGTAIVRNENARTTFYTCYSEGSQPPVFLNTRSLWDGGVAGAGVVGGIQENILYGEKHLYNGGFLVQKYLHVGTTTYDAAAQLKVYNDYATSESRVSIKSEGSTNEINQQFKNSTGATGTIQYIDSSFKFYNKLNNLAATIDSAGITANKFFGDGSALTGVSGGADSSVFYTVYRSDTSRQNIYNAINGKQTTLVSGTNIKTINSNSLLGSGNINISASAGGSTNQIQYNNAGALGGISNVKSDGTNILRVSDNSPVVYDYDVKGGATDLNSRIGTISNFASPNAGGIVTGYYYDNNPHGGVGTLAGAANRIDLAPYYTSATFSIDQIGCAVSTAVASSNIKIVIYSTGSNGWPASLLYESGDISTAATGYAFTSISFTFNSGTQYWLGVRHSSTATLRTIAVANSFNLGLGSSGANTTQATILRRTLTYATAAPSSWNFVSTDLTSNVTPPSIRFRVQ